MQKKFTLTGLFSGVALTQDRDVSVNKEQLLANKSFFSKYRRSYED